jgi:hypothetical protein
MLVGLSQRGDVLLNSERGTATLNGAQPPISANETKTLTQKVDRKRTVESAVSTRSSDLSDLTIAGSW